MLGRLGMSTEEALEHYKTISRQVFGPNNRKHDLWNDGKFKATTLVTEMKKVIKGAKVGYTGEEYMLDESHPDTGKVYVVPRIDVETI